MVVLVDATAEDFDGMLLVHRNAILAVNLMFYSDEQKKSWAYGLHRDGYAEGVRNGERYRVAINRDNVVCGFSSTCGTSLIALYVDPACQRKGIGAIMLHDAETRMRHHGITEGQLVASLNAETFYNSNGWVTRSFTTLQSRGGLWQQAVEMAKSFERNGDFDVG